MESATGQVLQRAVELDSALQAGFNVTLAEVTAEEFQALQIIRQERDRHEAEAARSNNSRNG